MTAPHLRTDLVTSALAMAVAMRGELTEEVILHADRGCQYTSAAIAMLSDRLPEPGYAGIMLQLNHSGPQ